LSYASERDDQVTQAIELARCIQDPVHWVNHWVWTFAPKDPIEGQSTLPFDLFPRQIEFLRWLQEREALAEDGLVEKSRDMGVTWLCCLHALHGWLFREGYKCAFGSRKLDLVDKIGDPDCIFEKLRFALNNLPIWMRPNGFQQKIHDCYCKLINPANGSTITGEGGDDIGRGGRAALWFIDEAAFLEHPQKVERSLSQTTRCRIDVSTPNGPGNPFATKRFSGKVPVFVFDWLEDARKNHFILNVDGVKVYPWYEEQKKRLDPVTLAQEVDRDYSASIEGICIPAAWVRAAVGLNLYPDGYGKDVEGVERPPPRVIVGFDVGGEGKDLSVLMPRRGPEVQSDIKSWHGILTTESAWRARDQLEKWEAILVNYDLDGIGEGIKGTWALMPEHLTRFRSNPINSGSHPTDTIWPDNKSSKEKFANFRAELWWRLRTRFERTYEYVTQGTQHRPEDMISIPNHPDLIAELSLPLVEHTDTGKVKIEAKKAMKARGVRSPNYADALAYAFAPDHGYQPPASLPQSTENRGLLFGAAVARQRRGGKEKKRLTFWTDNRPHRD
jgi:hypothetical protein